MRLLHVCVFFVRQLQICSVACWCCFRARSRSCSLPLVVLLCFGCCYCCCDLPVWCRRLFLIFEEIENEPFLRHTKCQQKMFKIQNCLVKIQSKMTKSVKNGTTPADVQNFTSFLTLFVKKSVIMHMHNI